jgi:hypothetical protein
MASFSGIYHPADMSMLKNMLNQQQQQRQFGQKQALAQQQFESQAPLRAAQMEQAQAAAELNRKKAKQQDQIMRYAQKYYQPQETTQVTAPSKEEVVSVLQKPKGTVSTGTEMSDGQIQAGIAMGMLTGKMDPRIQNQLDYTKELNLINARETSDVRKEAMKVYAGRNRESRELGIALDNYESQLYNPKTTEISGTAKGMLVTSPNFFSRTLGRQFTTEDQEKHLGALNASAGKVQEQIARALGKQMTGIIQNTVDTMKPNPIKDTYAQQVGKMEGIRPIVNYALKFNEKMSELLEQGYTEREAAKLIEKEMPFEQVRKEAIAAQKLKEAEVQAQMQQQMPLGTQYDFAGRPIKQQTTATQEAIPEKMSAGSKILAKDVEIPEFATKEEFLNYYNQQPKTVQNALELKYQGSK